ncbi:hypothetical protein ADUPG1_006898, partial [Aduncisulcus paluster]
SNSIVDISPLSTLTELITLNLSSNGIIDISSLTTLPSLTSIDVHSNQISDVSVLINENETTLLPTDVLEYLDISDNLICDIADVNTILSSYFTNSSFSLVSTESEQTCMCSPVPDFTRNEICFEVAGFDDFWSMDCWHGSYYNEKLAYCVEATSESELEICYECQQNDRMIPVLEESASTITCKCINGLTGDDCSVQILPSMETWVLVLIICGSVAVVCVVVVIIVKCSCSSKSSKKKSAHKRKNVSGQNSRDLPEMEMVSNPMFRKSPIPPHQQVPPPRPVIETQQQPIHPQPVDIPIIPTGSGTLSGDMIVSDPSMPPTPMPTGLVGSTPIPGHHDTTHVQEYDHMEPIMSGEIETIEQV